LKKLIIIYFFFAFLNIQSVYAQPGDPTGGGNPGGAVPISGIEILLIGGGAFGVKKLIQRKSKN